MSKYIDIDGLGEIVPRSEYDALVAQVEVFKSMFMELRNYHVCNYHTENQFIGRLAVHKNWGLISDMLSMYGIALHGIIRDSWLDGFHASNEGFNGEYREDEQLPNVLAKCFADGLCKDQSSLYQQALTACLADVRAEAVLDAIHAESMTEYVMDRFNDGYEKVEVCMVSDLKQYAERIRQGGV